MKPITKLNVEGLVLVIFCAGFLWFAASNILDNRISHEFPIGYLASDTFQNYGIAEGIKESGNYLYQPMSVAGGYKDVVGTHYPIMYHLVVLIHYVSGIEVYDALMLVVIVFFLSTSLTVYLIVRKYGKGAAFIALPLMILVSYGKFSSAITWGQHGVITGSVFLAALLWTITLFGFNNILLTSFFLAGTLHGHPPEFVFGMVFIAIYFLVKLAHKRLKLPEIKNLFISFVLTAVISFYYAVILRFTWASQGFLKLDFVTVQKFLEGRAFPPVLLFQDFNIAILIFVFIGILVSVMMLLQKKKDSALALLFLFFLCLSNYTGFGHKAFQQRFIWVIYISALFGIGAYFALKSVFKKVNSLYPAALFIILLVTFLSLYSGKTNAGSMMDQYHWGGFQWIRENVGKDEQVYFLYQDIITQRSLYYASTQRESYVIDIEGFIGDINEGMIKRDYQMALSAEGGAGLPYRKSLFEYGIHMPEVGEKTAKRMDICTMQYIVFDKASRQQQLANYNMMIANQLLRNEWVKEVYSNPVVSILRNDNIGEDCIVEQRIN